MKLEVGMYARTKYKGIVKIFKVIEKGEIAYEDDFGNEWVEETGRRAIRYITKDGWNRGIDEQDILNTSYNIIDLIEVGDYVNGCEVLGIREDYIHSHFERTKVVEIQVVDRKHIGISRLEELEDIHIKSIVTKEQFKSMEYKVGE